MSSSHDVLVFCRFTSCHCVTSCHFPQTCRVSSRQFSLVGCHDMSRHVTTRHAQTDTKFAVQTCGHHMGGVGDVARMAAGSSCRGRDALICMWRCGMTPILKQDKGLCRMIKTHDKLNIRWAYRSVTHVGTTAKTMRRRWPERPNQLRLLLELTGSQVFRRACNENFAGGIGCCRVVTL